MPNFLKNAIKHSAVPDVYDVERLIT